MMRGPRVKRSGLIGWIGCLVILFASDVVWGAQDRVALPDDLASIHVSDREAGEHLLAEHRAIRAAFPLAVGDDTVRLEVLVDEAGHVRSAVAVAGPESVLPAAEAVVRTWRYRPFFLDDKPVSASFSVDLRVYPPERRRAGAAAFPEVTDWSSVRIRLERDGCFGQCPSYTVEISGDGSVSYKGEGFTALEGEYRTRIPQDRVVGLIELFRAADFFSLRDRYTGPVTDMAEQKISLTIDGLTWTVADYVGQLDGMPESVAGIEDAIDRAAATSRWVEGSAEVIEILQARGVDFRSPQAAAMLAGAAICCNADFLRELLARGAPFDQLMDPNERAILWIFADPAKGRVVADAVVARGTQSQKTLALSFAVIGEDPGIVRRLIAGGAYPGGADDRRVLLVSAARDGGPRVVTELLKRRPGRQDLKDALVAAAQAGAVDNIRLLLGAGAGANGDDRSGTSPLYGAGNAAVVEMLVTAGADPNRQSSSGRRPLHGAERADVARALIAAGADPDAKDQDGNTPLIARARYTVDVAMVLIRAGATVSARGGGGKTALHLAGDGVVARALIAQGADINAQDDHGGTPLHQLDDAGAILAVIATGGDLNTRNDTGQVPMMTGSEDKALLLFAAGADPTLRDDRGVSVRAYAREKGWTRLLAKLGD
ncbi:ankyrin repeat protein [Inquilinus ginsengisoli]|uniref:DUF6438 domain-containing protein n=1 Tax=Inquilinus ginsengisoli TaxID=363840 RepID=UPI003D1BA686